MNMLIEVQSLKLYYLAEGQIQIWFRIIRMKIIFRKTASWKSNVHVWVLVWVQKYKTAGYYRFRINTKQRKKNYKNCQIRISENFTSRRILGIEQNITYMCGIADLRRKSGRSIAQLWERDKNQTKELAGRRMFALGALEAFIYSLTRSIFLFVSFFFCSLRKKGVSISFLRPAVKFSVSRDLRTLRKKENERLRSFSKR